MDRFDALMLIGGLAMVTGFGLISIPLGLIVAGALCMGLAIVGARAENVATRGEILHGQKTAVQNDKAK